MSFLINTIISGIVYDLFKEGTKITYQKVFGKFYGNMKTDSLQLYNEFIEKINIEESWNRKEKVIKQLDKLKEEFPNQEIIVETPNGTVTLKIRDANIYEGMRGEIVIDSE